MIEPSKSSYVQRIFINVGGPPCRSSVPAENADRRTAFQQNILPAPGVAETANRLCHPLLSPLRSTWNCSMRSFKLLRSRSRGLLGGLVWTMPDGGSGGSENRV